MKEFEKPIIELWKFLSENVADDIIKDSSYIGDDEEDWE